MAVNTGTHGGRPQIMATHAVVTSGHYLATALGYDILKRGGNAIDAAACIGFALPVLKPHQCGFGGEVPVLVQDAKSQTVHALSGHGVAPREATLARFRELGLSIIPGDGFLPAIVPPVTATWLALLTRYGSMRLKDVLLPVADLAEAGFPMYDSLHAAIANQAKRFREEWPSSAAHYLVNGEAPAIGTVFRQPDIAATYRKLVIAEAEAGGDRIAGLRAAHERFYRGDIAEQIIAFTRGTSIRDASGHHHHGLLSKDDLAPFEAHFEAPVHIEYRGWELYKCPSWSQGPVLLQMLRLLEGYDLPALGHNSADYLHLIIEVMKLAMADREMFYGDPAFVQVPLERLLSKAYALGRRGLIDPHKASLEQRPDGYPPFTAKSVLEVNAAHARFTAAASASPQGDTTKLEVADAAGNIVSATPSGGWLMSSPVIPHLGFPLGTRAQMFSLQAGHPNALAPGKRPRTTLTTAIAKHTDGRTLSFGSPGGDGQEVWALQFFLNVVEFGMSLQQAVEAPTVLPLHWPNSFYPRAAQTAVVNIEDRVPENVRANLIERGHILRVQGPFSGGNTLATSYDPATKVLCAAASPRLDPAYAMGY